MDVTRVNVDALDLKPETRRILKQAIRVVKSIDALTVRYQELSAGGRNK